MHPIDLSIVAVFFVAMLAFGYWLKDRQGSVDSYFVGDRRMGARHIGLSVVATDVGGGFSIGLGGLGFTMGLSGSWLLFTGLLGAWLAAVLFPGAEPEMGLPLLIKAVLPVGAAGLVMAAYFAAIMSTADSCLMAAVNNLTTDLYRRFVDPAVSEAALIRLSRWLVVGIGFGAIAFALALPSVLDSIVAAYAFMVAGLFVPTLAALFWPRATAGAAFWSMVTGGGSALVGTLFPSLLGGLEPIVVGLGLSAATLVFGTLIAKPPPSASSYLEQEAS